MINVSFDPTTQIFTLHKTYPGREEFKRIQSVKGVLFQYSGRVALCPKCGIVIPRSVVDLVDPKMAPEFLAQYNWPKFCLEHYEEHYAAGEKVGYVKMGMA